MQDEVPEGRPQDGAGAPGADRDRTLNFPVDPQPLPDPGPGDVVATAAAVKPPSDPLPLGAANRPVAVETTDEPAPNAGTGDVGSIPAVNARRAWARAHWSNWRLYLVRFVSAGLSVVLAVAIVPGISFASWRWGQGLEIALIFALLNALVKPVLQFLALRFVFSSFGIVIVLINTVLLVLLNWLMGDRLIATTFLSLLLAGTVVGLVGAAIDALLGADYPMLDRDYKERNGLA